MTYEVNKVCREIEQKLKKYNEHLDWISEDTKKKEEALNFKIKEDSGSAIAPPTVPNVRELSPQEFSERYAKDGQTFLTQRINEVAKFYPEKRAIDITPQREQMLKAIRIGTSTEKLIEEFCN